MYVFTVLSYLIIYAGGTQNGGGRDLNRNIKSAWPYMVFAFSALGDPGDPAAVREEIWLPKAPYGSLYKGGTRGDVVKSRMSDDFEI
jgi:hypothetical protein